VNINSPVMVDMIKKKLDGVTKEELRADCVLSVKDKRWTFFVAAGNRLIMVLTFGERDKDNAGPDSLKDDPTPILNDVLDKTLRDREGLDVNQEPALIVATTVNVGCMFGTEEQLVLVKEFIVTEDLEKLTQFSQFSELQRTFLSVGCSSILGFKRALQMDLPESD